MNKQQLEQRFIELAEILDYSQADLLKILTEVEQIPATVFATELSPLQAVVTYLSKNVELKKIAELTKRTYRAVWGAKQDKIEFKKTDYYIPVSAFNERLSILESVVKHLKDTYNLRYSAIARLLNKDQRTVWTVYRRAQRKNE